MENTNPVTSAAKASTLAISIVLASSQQKSQKQIYFFPEKWKKKT
jgi:hypothetical protein